MSSTDIPKYDRPQASLIRSSINNSKDGEVVEAEATPLEFKSPPKKRELTFKEKLKNSFVKEDLKDLGEYVLFDIVIPGIQRGAWEMVVGTASKAFGVPIPSYWNRPFYNSSGYSGRDSQGYTPYNQTAPRGSGPTSNRTGYSGPNVNRRLDIYSINTITWDYREDADLMLQRLLNVARTHQYVSVHTFYSLARVQVGNDYTNTSYGWPSQVILDEAVVDNEGYGYYICLPNPRELPSNNRW